MHRPRALLVTVLAGASLMTAGPAAATSCAPSEDASPAAVLAGTDRLAGSGHFFDRFTAAAVGTVVAVRTDERQGSPTYGATEIDVAVAAAFGDRAGEVGALVTLRAADPGWMNGPFWDVGASYFVPLFAPGPQGEEHWTSVCDPISSVQDAKGAASELAPIAEAAGVAVAIPDGASTDDGAAAPLEPSDDDPSGDDLPIGAIGGAAVLAASTTAAVALRRRGHARA